MKDKKIENMIQSIVILPTFIITLFLMPKEILGSGYFTLEQFMLIFLIPISIGIIKAIFNSIENKNKTLNIINSTIPAILIGISSGYGLISLMILFNWQQNPENGHFEPIFVALGIAITSTEIARRLTISDIKNPTNIE